MTRFVPSVDAFGEDVTIFRELGNTAERREWLRVLPGLVRRLEAAWDVQTGRPFVGGSSSWAAPATLADGTPVVLKVAWPHREAKGESIGLRLWGGQGAPVLYAADSDAYAVLMERCVPGRPLALSALAPEDGLIAAAAVLRKLWITPPAGYGLVALQIGRGTLRKVRQNLGWGIGYNAIALPIAAGVFEPAFGLVLRPEIAALSISGSSFIVAVNAMWLSVSVWQRRARPYGRRSSSHDDAETAPAASHSCRVRTSLRMPAAC